MQNLVVEALRDWLDAEKASAPVLLDVRECWETEIGFIKDSHCLPLSKFTTTSLSHISFETPIVVICHHGIRSAMVAEWLSNQGYTQVFNLEGGIDAWSRRIDQNIDIY